MLPTNSNLSERSEMGGILIIMKKLKVILGNLYMFSPREVPGSSPTREYKISHLFLDKLMSYFKVSTARKTIKGICIFIIT